MRLPKLTLSLFALALMSATLVFATPLGATNSDPIDEELAEDVCLFDEVVGENDPVNEGADAEESTEEEPDFFLHTGDQPREPKTKSDAKDVEDEVEPEKDEWFDEHVICGDDDDDLTLGEGDDEIELGGGDDDAEGGAGDDELHGGPGNDNLDGNQGNDRVFGEPGHDDLTGGVGNDRINGAAGRDDLAGGGGTDKVEGGAGSDEVEGGAGSDVIHGGPGDDKILSKDGNRDRIDCGPGWDRAVADKIDVLKRCEKR
jgi:Ca2+-binding RTX toxin-like protein